MVTTTVAGLEQIKLSLGFARAKMEIAEEDIDAATVALLEDTNDQEITFSDETFDKLAKVLGTVGGDKDGDGQADSAGGSERVREVNGGERPGKDHVDGRTKGPFVS
jgi:hypothetical protein